MDCVLGCGGRMVVSWTASFEGFVCIEGEGDCLAASVCECGQGWVAQECDPVPDTRRNFGTMLHYTKPGPFFLVCSNGHRRLYRGADPEPSTLDLLNEL